VLRHDRHRGIVEIGEVAGLDIDRADREPRLARIDAVEIDQPLQRLLERPRIVEAGCGGAAERPQVRRHDPRREETVLSADQGAPGGKCADRGACRSAAGQRRHPLLERRVRQQGGAADGLPELGQACDALLWRVAGQDRGIDRADGNAGEPVGLDAGLVQALIDAGLVRAERTAALQHQGHGLVGW